MSDQESVPAALYRGGTSKGVYVRKRAMPGDRGEWDDLLLDLFGSPDPQQTDGIGGARSTASKALLVSPGEGRADARYLFAQVGIDRPVVDWGGNCGNLTFAVGPFAVERGIVDVPPAAAEEGRVDLLLENENTGTVVEQSVPVLPDGSPRYGGEFRVHGVPGTGARIRSTFRDPAGSETGDLFPTGNRTDTLSVEGVGDVAASLVDVASPCVFVRAADLGLTAAERPEEVDADPDLLDRIERVRAAACARYGFVDDPGDAGDVSPGIPKMAMVGEKRPYETPDGRRVDPDEFDLLARIMSMQKAHHAYAVTGGMCTAVAAALPGTIPAEFADDVGERVRIGHPKGTMTVGVGVDGDSVEYAWIDRTARAIFDGDLYYVQDDD
ncbi:PrpF protein [Halobacteriales archaeon QS_8_69_26]|nr:MAG: PrpF protein [Halobacteriales archaeon QS_8_69_26]